MKKLILLLPVLILFSCSVQKRKYQKGFHVNWNKSVKDIREKREALAVKPVLKEPVKATNASVDLREPILTASSETKLNPPEVNKKKTPLIGDEPCNDQLIFKDGTEITGKVTEITATEVKYKKCDMLDGPAYVARKSQLFMIKYANGTREVFKEEANTTQSPSKSAIANKSQATVHPMAILSLVMGILALVPFITTLIFAILAIVFGNIALRRIIAQPGIYKGEGLAMAGRIIGIVLLCIVGFILIIGLIVVLALI